MPECRRCGVALGPDEHVWCDSCWRETEGGPRVRAESTLPPMTLTPDMHKALATAGGKVRTWTAERDRLIREARAQGATLREVGEAVGLTHTAVKLIEQRGET